MEAFTRVYGVWASVFLGVALMLFAYTTILTWSFYGENTFIYFMCEKAKIMSPKVASYLYRLIWLPPLVLAAVLGREYLGALWDLADTLNGLMAIPNLVAIVVLAPVAVKLLKDFYSRHLSEVAGAVAADGGTAGKTSTLLLLARLAWLSLIKRK